jgi:2'-5' RNA ligase
VVSVNPYGRAEFLQMAHTGLVIVIPEAEVRLGAMRRKFDPQVNLGVPAHITVLFPFMPLERVDPEVRRRITHLFERFSPFLCHLDRVGRFPATTYLAPASTGPLVALTRGVVAEFPDYPPYGGAHSAVIPHLTVADGDARAADLAEQELRVDIERHGAIVALCRSVRLLENSSGQWRDMHEFALVGHPG